MGGLAVLASWRFAVVAVFRNADVLEGFQTGRAARGQGAGRYSGVCVVLCDIVACIDFFIEKRVRAVGSYPACPVDDASCGAYAGRCALASVDGCWNCFDLRAYDIYRDFALM